MGDAIESSRSLFSNANGFCLSKMAHLSINKLSVSNRKQNKNVCVEEGPKTGRKPHSMDPTFNDTICFGIYLWCQDFVRYARYTRQQVYQYWIYVQDSL